MSAPRAWLFNLDADLELGARGPYTPTQAVLRAMVARAAPLLSLLREGDTIVDETTALGSLREHDGVAFCPTPRALARLAAVGARIPAHPTVDVLRRVASRAFSARLGPGLPGAAFLTDAASVATHVAGAPALGAAHRLKRAYGMAGRGHRRVRPGPLSAADRAFVEASMPAGLQVEPDVEIVEELAVHGVLAPDGALSAGRVVRQRCDARGAWLSTEPCETPHAARLLEELHRVGAALHEAGYFGPFGVDAYVFRDGDALRLQPRSEVNPRLSMGFAVGSGRP